MAVYRKGTKVRLTAPEARRQDWPHLVGKVGTVVGHEFLSWRGGGGVCNVYLVEFRRGEKPYRIVAGHLVRA